MQDANQGRGSVDSLPLDFTEFLSHRLNIHPTEAVALLGDCLLDYEPRKRYEIVFGPATRAA